MKPKYFDVHSHLNASQYDGDLEAVIARLRETETETIVVGTDLESSRRAVELAESFEGLYASVGMHPVDNPRESFNEREFAKLVSSPKVVAVGECGLDFFHADGKVDYKRQKKLFTDQIEFSLKYDKPLMLHIRNAYEESLDILTSYFAFPDSKLRGNVHFFAGNLEVARKFLALGFSLSFTGVITFTSDYDEVIKEAPLERLMSETDAPYVTPVPYRGRRNEPSYVSYVVRQIASIRGEDEERVKVSLVNNALSMIG